MGVEVEVREAPLLLVRRISTLLRIPSLIID